MWREFKQKFIYCCCVIVCILSVNLHADVLGLNSTTANIHDLLLQQGYTAIPLKRASKQDTLMIRIALGDGKYRLFLVDTGASHSGIDEKIALEYGFMNTGKILTTIGAGGHRQWTHYVLIPMMEVRPEYKISNLSFMLMSAIPQEDDLPIAGFLGLDFLRRNQAIIDISHQELYLKPLRFRDIIISNRALYNTLISAGYTLIPLERTENHHQTVMVQINQVKPVNFLLDTGAPVSLVDLEYAQFLQLQTVGVTINGHGSTGGEVKIFPTRVEKISIEGIDWKPRFFYIASGFNEIQTGIPVFGIIGMEWMRDNQAIIDTLNDRLFAKPGEKPQQSTLNNNFVIAISDALN